MKQKVEIEVCKQFLLIKPSQVKDRDTLLIYKGLHKTEFSGYAIMRQHKKTLIGYIQNQNLFGIGLFQNTQGTRFEGHFTNTLLSTESGRATFANGMVWEGAFQNNALTDGTITFKSGRILQVIPIESSGPKVMVTCSGVVSEGIFDRYGQVAEGRITWLDGTIFEGSFKHGQMDGHGSIKYADGIIFEGIFKHGELQGQGRKVWPGGERREGEFRNGMLCGKGRRLKTENNQIVCVEEGEFKDDCLEGKGRRVWTRGTVEDGEFKGGKILKGKVTQIDGVQWIGKFVQDDNWVGQKIFPDGRKEVGQFINGVLFTK